MKFVIEISLEDRDDLLVTTRVSAVLRAMAANSDANMDLAPLTVYTTEGNPPSRTLVTVQKIRED